MITCSNVQRIRNLDFGNYLLLPQYSHSYLKYEKNGYSGQVKVTPKMKLGSLVDDIRTNGKVDMASPLYPAAKKIATVIKSEFGWAIDSMEKQVSYTGDMILEKSGVQFTLPIKGRTDFVFPKKLILDLKITSEKNIDSAIKFLGYANQMFCYCKLDGCLVAYLLIYSTVTKEVYVRRIPIGDTNNFWEEKILKFGRVV